MSRAASAPPTCSQANSTAARFSKRCVRPQPSPAGPSGSAGQPSKLRQAWERVGSSVATVSRFAPASSASARLAPSPVSAFVTTTAKSAMSPSATGTFTPCSASFFSTVVSVAGLGWPARSASANVPMALPSASFGSHASRCAGLPANSSASVAKYTEDENGTGATARPSCSAITHSARCERPRPPCCSGMAAAGQPSSAMRFQSPSS